MIQAVETAYRNFRFRSRLEARWAVFMDALNIRWDYEAEGFDLGAGPRYLPDFWLPDLACWVEIKGAEASDADKEMCRQLNILSGRPTYLFAGSITNPPHRGVGWVAGVAGPSWWAVGEAGAFLTTTNGLGDPRHPKILRAFGLARGARFQFATRKVT